ncbi:MAG: MFS transporter [Phycisphaerales bacterium JB043]
MIHARKLPFISRALYRQELRALPKLVIIAAFLEPEIIAPLAMRFFDAGAMSVAALTAAPFIGFLSTLATTSLLRGHDRSSSLAWLYCLLTTLVIALTLLPHTPGALILFVSLVIAGRCILAITFSARTDIWRAAYPMRLRARVIGTFSIIGALIYSAFSLALGWTIDLADANPLLGAISGDEIARLWLLLAAILALWGACQYKHIRWRRRNHILAHERDERDAGLLHNIRAVVAVLKHDKTWRAYMIAQFVMGIPNLAAIAPLVYAVQNLYEESQTLVFTLTVAIPIATMLFFTPLWAHLLDRVGIIRFRVFHAWTFVGAHVLLALGLLNESLTLLILSRVVQGIGMSGGKIAWSIGHHEFAPREKAALYMGVHLALTGLRGFLGPFVGIILFVETFNLLGTDIPGLNLQGYTFIVFAILSVAGALLFARLNRQLKRGILDMPTRRKR